MKNKNTRAIVLRAGLALSMLFGAELHADHVSAAEQFEDSVQESPATETIFEVENASKDEIPESIEGQELVDETDENLENILEDPETLPEDKLEESEDSETLHKQEESLTDETIEDSEQSSEETQSEEVIVEDEAESVEDDFTDPTDEEKISEPHIAEDHAVEEESEEEVATTEDEEHSQEETDLEPASMTMSTSNDNSDELVKVDRIYGQNRFKNAVEISKKGWTTAPKVFLANGNKFADSLTGSPLAALNNAPILLTRDDTLPEVTLNELRRLNTKDVVILGGELSISKNIEKALAQHGFTVSRIGGNNRYTQAELVANEIMKVEGENRNAFLASGEVFSDALSIATIASNKQLPIYLTRGNRLEQSVLNAIPFVNSWTIIGGELTINRAVENQMKDAGAKVKRIAGQNRYEVNRNVMNYYGVPEDHLYVTSGEHYSDTLPASVLASKEKSGVLLLRNNNKKTNDEQKIFAQNKNKIRNFTFIGGPLTLSAETEKDFGELLRTVDNDTLEFIAKQFSNYTLSEYNIRLNDAFNMQMLLSAKPQTDKRYTAFVSKNYIDSKTNRVTADLLNVRSGASSDHHIIAQLAKNAKVNIINETDSWYQIDLKQYWLNASKDDVKYYLNPNNFVLSDRQMFQFLDLTRTAGATAAQLNNFLKGKEVLEGTGQAFIDAGKIHGVNEIYLLSHALLETGHGTSTLATGVQMNGNKVYNMYGVGAYDSNPVKYGALKAYEEKWFTPEEAIIGGAAFIGTNYVKAGQNTLYKMRWNPTSMAKNGYASHQYATDIGWASKQVHTIYNLYNSIGLSLNHVDIPVYLA